MAGVLSKGITLKYGAVATTPVYDNTVNNVQSIPDIGGTKESVEVTTLADSAHMYINGLISYGDSLDFTCLYTKADFAVMSALNAEQCWQVSLPDGTVSSTASFKGEPSVKVNGVGTGEAITYTLSIKPTSSIEFA